MSYIRFLAMSVLTLVALIGAACTSDSPPDATATPTTTDTSQDGAVAGIETFAAADGNFVVLISDEENAIGDFAHLWIYIDRIGVQVAGEGSAWLEYDVPVENQVVDLTQFVGDDATSLVQTNLPAGDYQKIFVRVEDVEGELVTGETVSVKLPSSRLKLNQPFTVGGDEVTPFVFDISVIAAGNANSGVKYILKPIVGESGSKKSFAVKHEKQENDLDVEVAEPGAEGEGHVVTITDDAGNPVEDAAVQIEVKLDALQTNADGEVTFGVPANAEEIKAEVEFGEAEGEIHLFIADPTDFDDEQDDEDEDERLTIVVVGDLVAGAPLTLRVTDAAGAPVVGADVEVELEIVAGVTGADGTLTVDAPADAAKVEAEARTEDGRGNSERKGRRDHDEDDDEHGDKGDEARDGREHDDATGDNDAEGKLTIAVEGETVAGAEVVLTVTDESGAPVEGVEIEINDAIVGATDADGKLTITLPTGVEKAEIDAKLGEAEGEIEIEL
ncbi:MAG: DUF4382 domain-containing protein [Chloroflexi bacterium]|nr:DUF4382 domain-containing protein [Chloroflexota bacterium]